MTEPRIAEANEVQRREARLVEDEGVPDAERLAIDFVDAIALIVFDPGVVPDRSELLLHLETAPARSVAPISQ